MGVGVVVEVGEGVAGVKGGIAGGGAEEKAACLGRPLAWKGGSAGGPPLPPPVPPPGAVGREKEGTCGGPPLEGSGSPDDK